MVCHRKFAGVCVGFGLFNVRGSHFDNKNYGNQFNYFKNPSMKFVYNFKNINKFVSDMF